MNFTNKRILVTGGNGFLGRYVVAELLKRGCRSVEHPTRDFLELIFWDGVLENFREIKPEIVVHLAAKCGGIGANRESPADFFYENASWGLDLMETARNFGVEKYLQVGTVCSYPKHCPVPFKESDLWNGYPEETNAPYGLAKRMLIVQAQAYRQQYGFNAVTVIPTNLYGPGDNFDPQTSHVIPALIRKMIEARESGAESVEVWGDGSATRDFLYVEDAARGIVDALEKYDSGEPMNLGSGQEIKIMAVADLIRQCCDYKGVLNFNISKPNGQPRRCLNSGRAVDWIDWCIHKHFVDGISDTVAWYEAQRSGQCQPR